MSMNFSELPKVELHCHLDGGMDADLVDELLKSGGENYAMEELRDKLRLTENAASLADYLARFDLPIRLLQTEYALSEQAYRLARTCAAEHVIYLEVRFAPTSHQIGGLRLRTVMECVRSGLLRAEEECGIRTGMIICAMRHFPEEKNLELLYEARELLGDGVVAFDLAGDEAGYPLTVCAGLFREASRIGMPFTIHAGEVRGSRENVRLAAELGASRIGHGIDMRFSPELMELCAKRRIGVELCPTSNLQTGGIGELSELPIRDFMERGIPVSISTDNRTIGNTSCTHEMERVDRVFSMSSREWERIFYDSVEMSFAADGLKEELREKWKTKRK